MIPPPAAGAKKTGQKSRRRPLQPRNFLATPTPLKKITEPIHFQIANIVDSNKENHPVVEDAIAPFDPSLAEELVAIRRKLERLRLEKEKTERVLKERDFVLEKRMRDWEKRVEEQNRVEMEIKKILKLKELKSSWTGEPLKSLREAEREGRIKTNQFQDEEGVKMKQTAEKEDELQSCSKGDKSVTSKL
ncbi:high mobility group B protein 6 [Aristolochia californica]|uniref:high mobility group B protein 6 n=1 Tax=Aristolochia californica TaxID=171875 RepID=UPI0035DA68D8